jgi:hypothetical protein
MRFIEISQEDLNSNFTHTKQHFDSQSGLCLLITSLFLPIMPSSAKYNHLWPIFFVLAGVSNLIQAWAFYYSEIPSLSAAAILHMKPDMLSAISKGFCGYYPKRVLPPGSLITGDLLPRSGAEFFGKLLMLPSPLSLPLFRH